MADKKTKVYRTGNKHTSRKARMETGPKVRGALAFQPVDNEDKTAKEIREAFESSTNVADTIDRLANRSNNQEVHAALMKFVQEARGLDRSLAVLAESVALAHTPATVAAAHVAVRRLFDAADALKDVSRQKAVAEVVANGALREEGKLGRVLTVKLADGREATLRIDPLSTTPDAKRTENVLRSKGLSPDEWMDREVTYSVNRSKLEMLRANGTISEGEYEAMKPPLVWKLTHQVKESVE